MTTFEIIIFGFIYLLCYGYLLAMITKEKSTLLRVLFTIVALVLVIYVPLFIGGTIYEKLNNKKL